MNLKLSNTFLVCTATFSSFFSSNALARPLAVIKSSKELRACVSPNNQTEPVNCTTNCQYIGNDKVIVDIVSAFAKTLGSDIKPLFMKTDWDEQFKNSQGKIVQDGSYTPKLLESGACDLYPSNLTKNDWREKKMDFAILFKNRMMILVNTKDRLKYKSIEDLAGKTAGLEPETTWIDWVKEQNATTLKKRPVKIVQMKTVDAITFLESGKKIDFTVVDSDVALWTSTHGRKKTSAVFSVGVHDSIGWAFQKDDKELRLLAESFFATQKAKPQSELDVIWLGAFGLSVKRFENVVGK
jgi:membrane-bound lytic murein transglycosylase F